jgi:hypothetical protein
MDARVGYGHVYLISDGTFTKVGYSTNPHARVKQLQTAHPNPLKIVALFEAERDMEVLLHEELEAYHVRGEWYRLDEDAHTRIHRIMEEMLLEVET